MSYPSYDLTLNQIIRDARDTSREHGWWAACAAEEGGLDVDRVLATIPEKLCLIHSEVSAALEDYRDRNFGLRVTEGGKPVGFDSELADVIIRIGDLAGALGLDLEAAVMAKLQFNRARPFRHGGKLA